MFKFMLQGYSLHIFRIEYIWCTVLHGGSLELHLLCPISLKNTYCMH